MPIQAAHTSRPVGRLSCGERRLHPGRDREAAGSGGAGQAEGRQAGLAAAGRDACGAVARRADLKGPHSPRIEVRAHFGQRRADEQLMVGEGQLPAIGPV